MRQLRLGFLSVAFILAGHSSATSDGLVHQLTSGVREVLKPHVQEQAGSGFESFGCSAAAGFELSQPVQCTGIAAGDIRMEYLVETDHDGTFAVTKYTRHPARVPPQLYEAFAPLFSTFRQAFNDKDWRAVRTVLSGQFRKEYGVEDIEDTLAPIRSQLGQIRNSDLKAFGGDFSGSHEFVYVVEAENGPGMARFVVSMAGNRPLISGFAITPKPGSRLFTEILEATGRRKVAEMVGEPVQGITAEFGQLKTLGDSVEGVAHLADGREMQVLVSQKGPGNDLDVNDYRFAVLDLPFVLRRTLESLNHSPERIDCPVRTVPDGERIACSVTMADGNQLEVEAVREGGEYGLRNFRMPPRLRD